MVEKGDRIMCAFISIALLIWGLIETDPMILMASGAFAICAEIKVIGDVIKAIGDVIKGRG
jgi:hypothetical protein